MQRTLRTLNSPGEILFRIFIIAVIAMGIVLRASKYLPGWSMRGDELAVTRNLISRSALDLVTRPLDDEQAAPFGFLLLSKTVMTLFGRSEYVLRIISFISGCASLVLMYRLLAKTCDRYGTLFALTAFALSYYLIYYSAELKQYASDVLICIILALFFHNHISRETNARDFWQLGVAGALGICFSHPAIFVVIAIGCTLVIHYRRERKKLLWVSIVGFIWAGLFLLIYLILLRKQTGSEYLITFWRNLQSFMPMPPWKDPAWFPGALMYLFSTLSGLAQVMYFVVPLYLYGLWMFFKEKRWQWITFTSITILLNMVVSGFEKFPFHGRLIIYLLPLVFLVFGKGLDELVRQFSNRNLANAVYAALFILLLSPSVNTINNFLFTHSYLQDDIKPVLIFLEENQQSGDLVYLYHYINRQFEYYAPSYNLQGLVTISGEDHSRNGKKYQDELSSLPQGQRIWFLFSFVGETRIDKGRKMNEREYILDYLGEHGSLVTEFYSTNKASSAHLYILK